MDKNSILIVVDIQNDFINGTLGSSEAEAIIPVVEKIINNFDGYKLYATRDMHYHNNYSTYIEGNMIPIHCATEEGQAFHPTINTALENHFQKYQNSEIIHKNTFGSLYLADILYEEVPDNEINTIYIVGLCTDICVISNALMLRAACPKAHIVVFENACAGSSPRAHEAALKIMKSNCIEVETYVSLNRGS